MVASMQPAAAVPCTTTAHRNQCLRLAAPSSPACSRLYPPTARRLEPSTPRLPVRSRAQQEPQPSSSRSEVTAIARRGNSSGLEEQTPFLEPLLRNLVLGVSAGALVELLHVVKVAGTAASSTGIGMHMLPFLLPQTVHTLAPLYLWDHIVACGVWGLLYLVEAYTVHTIINQTPDADKAARAIRNTITLPKRMLPMSMTSAKRAIYKLMTGFNPATATASSSASSVPSAAQPNKFTTGDFAREAERRARLGRSGGGVSAGTSVLDRPPVMEPPKEAPAAPPQSQPGPATIPPPTPMPLPEPAPAPRGPEPLPSPGPAPPIPPVSGARDVVRERPADAGKVADAPHKTKESKREREIRERKAYLKDFWYCVGISETLKDKPQEVKILGRTVVIFRDQETGKVQCMENLCPHRGAPLGQGWTKEVEGKTCVVCPYHGWAFDGQGKLKDVPASTRGQLPKRQMVSTYPIEEKGGFIWLYFGSNQMPAEERAPIPWISEFEDPNWRAVYAEMEFDAPHWSTFDNALDMAHIHYVHVSSFGNPDKPEILDMSMKRDTFGIEGSFKIHNKPVNKLWEWTRVPHVPVEVKGFLPMSSAVRIQLAHGVQMITFVNTVPIDEHRSINRFCLLRNFAASPLLDGVVKQQMFQILGEDKEMVETVRPDDMPVEYSLEADLPQIAFRKLRKEWVDMGYAVDPSATVGHKGSLNM